MTRLSADSSDPGYAAFQSVTRDGKVPFAFLDGVEQRSVITADEEQGLIVCSARDSAGDFIVRDGEILTEILYGVVRIELRERAP